MATFDFDKVDEFVNNNKGGFDFLKLEDNGWFAKVRFMYGPGEAFKGESVHKIDNGPNKPAKFIPCLREAGQPLDVCPLCKAGQPNMVQYYIPVFVISITKVINGIQQPEEPVNKVMIFQRGKTFQGALASAVRQSVGTPLVNNIFNIVRNGKVKATDTTYLVEFVSRDNTSLESLPERPQVLGTYILPQVNYQDMLQYVIPSSSNLPQDIVPRTYSTTTNLGNGYISPNPQNIPF